MTPRPSEYGRALRNWRTVHSLRVEDVAHHCGISVSTIRNHEQGRTHAPTRGTQRAIVAFSRDRGIQPPAWWAEPQKEIKTMRVQIWAEHTLRAGRRCHADEIGEGCDVGETEVNIFEGTPDELRDIVSAYRRNAERDPGHQHAYELLKARTLEDAIDDET